jgi:hypothetical protein
MNKQELIEKFSGNVIQAIKYVESLRPEYPVKPVKPLANSKNIQNITSADALEWSKKLEVYEKEIIQYHLKKDHYQATVNLQEIELVEFIKDECNFYELVPERSREKVWSKAWSDGHSCGYYEVYQHLNELVDLF